MGAGGGGERWGACGGGGGEGRGVSGVVGWQGRWWLSGEGGEREGVAAGVVGWQCGGKYVYYQQSHSLISPYILSAVGMG